MNELGLSQDGWLNLGVPGAALLIVLTVVLLLFRQQARSIDKLCTKIDSVITSFAENNLKLNEVVICNDRDQSEMMGELRDVREVLNKVDGRIQNIDYHLNMLSGSQTLPKS